MKCVSPLPMYIAANSSPF